MKIRTKLKSFICDSHARIMDIMIPRARYNTIEYNRARMITYAGLSIYVYLIVIMFSQLFGFTDDMTKVKNYYCQLS